MKAYNLIRSALMTAAVLAGSAFAQAIPAINYPTFPGELPYCDPAPCQDWDWMRQTVPDIPPEYPYEFPLPGLQAPAVETPNDVVAPGDLEPPSDTQFAPTEDPKLGEGGAPYYIGDGPIQ